MSTRDTRSDDEKIICAAKHKPLYWAIGLLSSLLIGLLAMVGWCISASKAASADAEHAARSTEAVQIRTTEYREYMKQDISDLKGSVRGLSEKVDKMNESVQRLIQKNEPNK